MRLIIHFLVASFITTSLLLSGEPQTEPYITYPGSFEYSAFHYSIGASVTLFPRFVVEEEIRQIPMVNALFRYGLPSNFSLTAQVSTVYITNVVSLGAMWSHSIGDISFAVSDEFSYWFGFGDVEGFDTNAMGLLNRPGISAGIDIDSYKITAKSELLVLISQHTYFGSASVGRVKPEIAGIISSVVLEQDIWNSTYMSFALRANYARPNYQVWLAFSVQDKWLLYPDLQISFLF